MALTDEQRSAAEQELQDLINRIPEDIKKGWDGEIVWSPNDVPMVPFVGKLKGRPAAEYATILDKINNGQY